MQSKSFLIALAAFAVTTTGVHAYGGPKVFNRAGLSDDQVAAIEAARELRAVGDAAAARDQLLAVGITEDDLRALHHAADDTRRALHNALRDDDFAAFKLAVAGSPLADIVITRADFTQFREAHQYRQHINGGDLETLTNTDEKDLLRFRANSLWWQKPVEFEFTDEQREALRVARQANDRATVQAIFDEAGFEAGWAR